MYANTSVCAHAHGTSKLPPGANGEMGLAASQHPHTCLCPKGSALFGASLLLQETANSSRLLGPGPGADGTLEPLLSGGGS